MSQKSTGTNLLRQIREIVPPLQVIEGLPAEQFTIMDKCNRFNQLRELLDNTPDEVFSDEQRDRLAVQIQTWVENYDPKLLVNVSTGALQDELHRRQQDASCQQGEPCGDPERCPDPEGCGQER